LQVTTCYKLEFRRGKWWSQVDHVTGKWTQNWQAGNSNSAWTGSYSFTVSINSNGESRRSVDLLQALDSCKLSLCELGLSCTAGHHSYYYPVFSGYRIHPDLKNGSALFNWVEVLKVRDIILRGTIKQPT
jgi:hypothetical protein